MLIRGKYVLTEFSENDYFELVLNNKQWELRLVKQNKIVLLKTYSSKTRAELELDAIEERHTWLTTRQQLLKFADKEDLTEFEEKYIYRL